LVIQDARRGEVYLQGFAAAGTPVGEAQVLTLEAAAKQLASATGAVVGSGVGLVELPRGLKPASMVAWPDVSDVARLAAAAEPTAAPPVPFYLREPDAKAQAPLVRHQAAEISIQQVGAEHAAVLAAIHAAAFDDAWDEAAISILLGSPGCIGLMARSGANGNGEPCGFVLARKAADEIEILTIAVLAPIRRRGVGKALLDHLSASARSASAASIFIEYAADNAAAAQLYAQQGFRTTGLRKHYYRRAAGPACDAVTARLDL
jgi:ribosomal-protein-alanine N-acetyltransferase